MYKSRSLLIVCLVCTLFTACSELPDTSRQTVSANATTISAKDTGIASTNVTSTPTLSQILTMTSTLEKSHSAAALAFSPDGRILAAGKSNGTIQLFSIPDGKEVKVIQAHSSTVRAVAFSPDGKTLASGAAENTVKFWSVVNGQLIKQLKVDREDVTGLKFSPTGDMLLTLGTKRFTGFELWSIESSKLVDELGWADNYQVRAADFSPDNTLIGFDASVSIYHGPGLHLWRFREVKSSDKVDLSSIAITIGEKDQTTAISFSPDSKLVASAYIPGVPATKSEDGDKSDTAGFEIWSTVDSNKRLLKVDGISDYINWLAFSPDGHLLFSVGKEQVIRIWSVQNGQELFHTNLAQTYGLQAVALSSDGKYIATGHLDGSVKLWQVN